MACRNVDKAQKAREEVLQSTPGAALDVIGLDLGDLRSVRTCADEVSQRYDRVDIVLCNAGLMAVPFGRTKDGFETHMGVNYFGHFALVGHLMPLIARSPGTRVVTASSTAEKFGRLNLDRPWTEKNYQRYLAYSDSKLAILMFALSLDERFNAQGMDAMALSAHPGFTRSNLRTGRLKTERDPWQRFQLKFYESLSMSLERGAYPLLYAATDPEAQGGEYIGVSGLGEIRGFPKITRAQKRAYDPVLRQRLWSVSEEATGVMF
jgi:NAD(P)-dependent dehydrogenase (short-subunit alcohol dehydrogenase family)